MNYLKEDVKLEIINHVEFENLCYNLLAKYNFQNLVWRKGGADSGRDIEGYYTVNNALTETKQKWFFECKHHAKGISVDTLNSKILWADAEAPDYLVFFISSYLTNDTRDWLNKIAERKSYKIIIIEGEELKNRISVHSDLVERYFSFNGYKKMLKDFKEYNVKYNIPISYEFFKVFVGNVDLEKLDNEDLGLLLFGFYRGYLTFEKNIYFEESVVDPILNHLKNWITNEHLSTFSLHKDRYEKLFGVGIFSDIYFLDVEDLQNELRNFNFQYYELLLNYSPLGKLKFIPPNLSGKEKKIILESSKGWERKGEYLFIICGDVAIEIFKDITTEIRIIRNYNQEKFKENSFLNYDGVNEDYKRLLQIVKTNQSFIKDCFI